MFGTDLGRKLANLEFLWSIYYFLALGLTYGIKDGNDGIEVRSILGSQRSEKNSPKTVPIDTEGLIMNVLHRFEAKIR